MEIKVDLVVSELFQAEKSHYITGVDTSTGGLLKVGVDGLASPDVKIGTVLRLAGQAKPNIGKNGLYLKFLGK